MLTDLKERKITLSDSVCDAIEIDLLIGADVMGKLLTENVELDSGLTAVESKLGWKNFPNRYKAFLMLSVAPKDRYYLRVFPPGSEGQEIYRHCRVVLGVCSSPYLLNTSLMHLLENCPPECNEIIQKLQESFYVDNLVSRVFNVNELEQFIEQSKNIMSRGYFNLRGFESNVVYKNVDKHSGCTSVLGIIWDLDNDTLSCCLNLELVLRELRISKTVILSIVQRIFDPIG
ncbi:uncharacterized protein NPIL_218591 [Nephila pilipes]|uniref:Uncharacterized protein n=1 Tax=Nephila pilipes TaxID=299642 RepID=A0A8X6K9Y6_NEPPI|nr:uncharacterized protein NPIL_218591 [Nephila pilipes]